MCGLVAVVGADAMDRTIAGLDTMQYRGTRSCVTRINSQAAIGHVRLPIVGLGVEYDQPVKKDPWTIAFVGEILDFREREPGAECDTKLITKTWVEKGPSGFTKFDGFWSVAAYDRQKGILYGLVDYLAQKPLYTRVEGGYSAIASEPNALVVMGPVTLDEIYFSAVIKWGYCPETDRTPYKEIKKIQPGCCIGLEAGVSRGITRVDPLHPTKVTPEVLREEIEKAITRRVLSSDVPVAALVSGGLDSSIVYTLASRHGEVEPYHVENQEWGACQQITPEAVRLGIKEVAIDHALDYMQEPLDLGSLLPQTALSDAIEGKARVCLTGDGADELFGGYSRSLRYDSQASDVWHELVAWHLPRLDRVMMRNRIEVRSPFLARRVVEAALALPQSLRYNKRILRDLFREDLPQGIADRPKQALKIPAIETDREAWSIKLVEQFKKQVKVEICQRS